MNWKQREQDRIENGEYKPLPDDDPTQRQPVIKLAHDKLNWHPRIKLIEGLKKTITYFRERLNIIESKSVAA